MVNNIDKLISDLCNCNYHESRGHLDDCPAVHRTKIKELCKTRESVLTKALKDISIECVIAQRTFISKGEHSIAESFEKLNRIAIRALNN